MPASIFRAYDIRGVVGKSLTPDVVKAIGRAIGTEAARLNQQTVAVGRDGRISGPILAEALIEGLRSTGRDVVDV
ncbi:MAG: phosphomannomutase/phosphoglucomutase, partial [Gammaproteobacteria bacterium]|nr:phosphomannomutase/phosphoglucomutase [Gammaproteobacteria bacterium]MDH3414494.1 phosphomannomutase/phosphoglucomutase [Gammaproteobacteria bacterium]